MTELSSSDPLAESRIPYEPVPAGSRLDRTLEGLDPNFALATLKEGLRRELELRYGLVDGRPRTAAEVAQELGHHRSFVHNVETQALIALREVRDEHRPERVFERDRIPEIDDAYLLPAASPALKAATRRKILAEASRSRGVEIPSQKELTLQGLLDLLTPWERQILELKTGIDPKGPLTRSEIARELKIKRESVGGAMTRIHTILGSHMERLMPPVAPSES